MCYYVDLSKLPIKYHSGKKCIDWEKSIGMYIKFAYSDIEDKFYIDDIEHNGKHTNIFIKYNNRIEKISSYNLIHNNIKRLMDKFYDRYVCGFRYNINDVICDEKRNIVIIDRFYNNKKIFYKYKCNKCGYSNGMITQDNLINGKGCSCCNNKVVVEGINDIPTTSPWMVQYFIGGYEEARKYTHRSGVKKIFICPFCGRIRNKEISIDRLYKTHSIGCTCSDGRSYPEKVMFNLLEILGVDFIYQFNPKWLSNYNGSRKSAIFDFYIPENNLIIEMDGMIGHGNYIMKNSHLTIEDTINKDRWKDLQACKNGCYVIRIDSIYSDIKYISSNIINSKLSSYYNLSNIDWNKIDELSTNNLVKDVCLYYNDNIELTQKEIAIRYKITPQTVRKYLKIGNKFGWCQYNVK